MSIPTGSPLAGLPRGRWLPIPLVALLASYLPDLGHGFIKDDFAWILQSRLASLRELPELLARQNGFYRPLVALSFAIDERVFGLGAFGYGLTNLLLAVAAMLLLFALARALGCGPGVAALAAGLWSLNPHGIGGAILWISGRTALCLTLFALLTALLVVRGHLLLASLACLLALLSKEEATLVPPMLAVWAGLGAGLADPLRRWDGRAATRTALALLAPLVLYLLMRSRTDAFLPGTAPACYRPTLDPWALLRNVAEYADRSATLALALLVLAMLVARARPHLTGAERNHVILGAVWLLVAFGLTVFLPVRSSLYVVFPSVGVALAAAVALGAVWRGAPERSQRALRVGALMAAVLLIPLHRSRNVRLERTASLSTHALAATMELRDELSAGEALVLIDEPGRINLAAAFGTLVRDAVRLQTGLPDAEAWIEPPPPDWQAAGLARPHGPAATLCLRSGRILRQEP